MKWTDKSPTKPGWYFYQATKGPHPIRMGYVDWVIYPQILKPVLTLFGCHNLYGQAVRNDWSVAIQDISAVHRWAGPIEEPSHEMD